MKSKGKVLVTEDDEAQRLLLKGFLSKQGYEVSSASSGTEALAKVKEGPYDVILLDYHLPDGDGLQFLPQLQQQQPGIPVLFITAYGTIEIAVQAMKLGASDFLTKPIDLDLLLLKIDKVCKWSDLTQENRELKDRLRERYHPSSIIYASSQIETEQLTQMEEVLGIVARVAPSTSTVLIRGESGTGKELIAAAIHYASPRHDKPFIKVNCNALPEGLLESELFGHERGAFTGAIQRRIGRLEAADGGTLFLDEVGDLPGVVQTKLLRFLQEREFERLGTQTPIRVDVRIIAATHRDLEAMVAQGDFREDLYYRLQVIPILLPPLRERREDIPLLIDHFLRKFCQREGKEITGIAPEARHLLLTYDYPGNVRELENLIERAIVLSRGGTILREDLPLLLRGEKAPAPSSEEDSLPSVVSTLEREAILQALRAAKGNQSRAARQLQISERVLRYKMKKYGLVREG